MKEMGLQRNSIVDKAVNVNQLWMLKVVLTNSSMLYENSNYNMLNELRKCIQIIK